MQGKHRTASDAAKTNAGIGKMNAQLAAALTRPAQAYIEDKTMRAIAARVTGLQSRGGG